MGSLWERLNGVGGEARLRGGSALTVAEIIGRLEAGESAGISELAAADLLASLAFAALGGDDALGPALIQQAPARPRLKTALEEPAVAKLLPGASRPARLALAAGLLQIHDFWDSSHEAAQAADDLGERGFSAYWHGIAHRREPDAGNAAYWFRRVGRHAVSGPLAQAARPILERHGDNRWTARLVGGDAWNSQAMIDLCTGARPGSDEETLARRLQRLEMQLLLDATVDASITGR
ncbi:MAG TPA: hypothetical protein VKF17_03390 [Isosphaeraceae bacterium]|nr:hypothetical protein [Isosphaeraceae bacterium]